jgi:dephospho-CoA kinase
MLADLGARVIDADRLAHQVMRAGTPTWHRVVETFGPDSLQPDGEINRAQLGSQVFADPEALATLDSIVHPAVITESERLLRDWQDDVALSSSDRTAARVAVLEAIKLIESGMRRQCDELWVVTCSRERQLERLVENRGLSQAEAELRITAQTPQEEKIAAADVVIDNDASLEQTRAQVMIEWERIVQGLRHQEVIPRKPSLGGHMSSWKKFVDEHPFLTMWAVLAVGMVVIFLFTSRTADLLPSQRFFMAVACVLVAGLCTWIISWEESG